MTDKDKLTFQNDGYFFEGNYSLLLLENRSISLTDAVLLDSVQKGKRI